MNKKLLFGAALVLGMGAVTSCVDNNESASVIKIREAKAEQLKSIAELNNANAQAALILANAEKAAKDAQAAFNLAQAEYQKALAAKANADAALVMAQTEAEKAKAQQEADKAAVELQQMQVALQGAQAQLKATLAELDAAIEQSKVTALKAQQQYAKLLEKQEAAEASKLQTLISNYDNASKTLIAAKRSLAKAELELVKLETGLADAKQIINDDIAGLQEDIADQNLIIAENQAKIEIYQKYAGTEVTADQVQEAHIALVEATDAYNADMKAYNDAYYAAWDAKKAVENSKYVDAVNVLNQYGVALSNPNDGEWLYSSYYYPVDQVSQNSVYRSIGIVYYAEKTQYSSVPKTSWGKWNVVIYNPNNERVYIPVFEGINTESNEIEYSYGDKAQTPWEYSTYTSYLNLINDGEGLNELAAFMEKVINPTASAEVVEQLKKDLADYQEAQAEAQKEYDDAEAAYQTAVAATATAKATMEAKNEAVTTAQNAYDVAKALADKADATDAQKADAAAKLTALTDAQTAAATATTAYSDAVTAEAEANTERQNTYSALNSAIRQVNNCLANINSEQVNAENVAQRLEDFKADVANIIAAAPDQEALIADYNTAAEDNANAYVAFLVSQFNKSEASSEYHRLQDIIDYKNGIEDGNSDANSVIAEAQKAIADAEKKIERKEGKIADLQKELRDIENGKVIDNQASVTLIADKKAEIEKLTVEVATAQQKFDIAKAELEAAVGQE